MHFGLSPAQELLQRSVRDLVARECPLERVRELVVLAGEERAAALAPWRAVLADQGATGILAPQDAGGLGGSLLDAAVLAQELGRGVAPIALHEAWTLGALLLAPCAHRELAAIVAGTAAPSVIATGLARDPTRERIVGGAVTAGGPHAGVVAVVGGGDGEQLVWLPPATEGLEREPLDSIDVTRPLWTLRVDVAAAAAEVLDPQPSADATQRALEAARVVLAADLLGAAQRALEIAVAYSLERRQFGRVVGSYQAVKHVCAERAAALEPLQAMLWHAAHAWDTEHADAAWLAPLLKAHAAEVADETVTQATQVFGGMGFTWECDAHLFYKRVAQSRQLLGGPVELRAEAAARRYG